MTFLFKFYLCCTSILNQGTANGIPNATVFIILYVLGLVFELNSITKRKLSASGGTETQNRWSKIALCALCMFIVIAIGIVFLLHLSSWYQIIKVSWLLILLAVGLHFFFFVPVHGKAMAVLATLTILNVLVGIPVHESLDMIFILDGTIKIIFGLYFIKVGLEDRK